MPLMRRKFRDAVELSILGFGGMVAVGMDQSLVNGIVAESIERGVNYFDVAPFYGNGEAEQKLGVALSPFRRQLFLACKTLERNGAGASAEFERSLGRLKTDYLDLYQIHAITTLPEVEAIFGPGGAMECLVSLKESGRVRYLGFSAHSVEAAMAMMDRFSFDSILFPVNFVCFSPGNFGPQVLGRAKELGVARMALKAMALTNWGKTDIRNYPKCWYKPITDPDLASKALRFTLSEDVTSALPPGEEPLFRMALGMAESFMPLTTDERKELLDAAGRIKPLMKA